VISETENKILQAAKKVFISKGYAATKTRDIAEEADINIASLHYYYRSKDKLFQIIAEDAIKSFNEKLDCVFCKELTLEEKVNKFVSESIDFFMLNPFIPLFIMNEMNQNIEMLDNYLNCSNNMVELSNQLNKLTEEGKIRKVDPNQFMINLLSMTIFPFVGFPMICKQFNIDSAEFNNLLIQRKKLIPELVLNDLRI
tara:strand:+ start:160 stop:753 length:594 start_codon:yes stop_codon:yes gene_type:complete